MSAAQQWGVVIVNYNSARFALDAALSALGDNPDAKVVIVDNGSTNNSLEILQTAIVQKDHHSQPLNNPVSDVTISAADIADVEAALIDVNAQPLSLPSLTIVQANENRGFAAGCNIGLRLLEAVGGCSHYLLLNPDTQLGVGAFDAFKTALDEPGAGLCGGTVLLANDPGKVQAFGGARLNRMTLLGENIGGGEFLFAAPKSDEVEKQLTYPLGAAIALKAGYLKKAGYLDDRYFLYYEEADWAFAGKAFSHPVWASDAYVFHHYGVSSKSDFARTGQPSNRSPLADYHMARSRFLFALKWRPWLAPAVLVIGLAQSFRRLLRGRFKSALAVARGILPGAARVYPS